MLTNLRNPQTEFSIFPLNVSENFINTISNNIQQIINSFGVDKNQTHPI